MRYVQEHLTHHHFFHAPHKWFFAILLSPIHAAEMHYKKKYHLKFVHAKKLFLFDLLLLLSTIGLIGLVVFWFVSEPTIDGLVSLSITPSTHGTAPTVHRIASGEHLTFTIEYGNQNDVTLKDVNLTLGMPKGFIMETIEPNMRFSSSSNSVTLDSLAPQASGKVTMTGLLFGTPEKQETISASLSYRHEGNKKQEQKTAHFLVTLRGSVLKATLNTPAALLARGVTPFSVTLTNTYHHDLPLLIVPLRFGDGVAIASATTTTGVIQSNEWRLPSLAPHASATLTGVLATSLSKQSKTHTFTLIPIMQNDTNLFPQEATTKTAAIIHPSIVTKAAWTYDGKGVSPGTTVPLVLSLTNDAETAMTNLEIEIPLSEDIVEIQTFLKKNVGIFKKTHTIIRNATTDPSLALLPPKKTITLPLEIPIRSIPVGTDIVLILTPTIRGGIEGIQGSAIEHSVSTPPLSIGTALLLGAEARYYTNEGDQLGRGPLPPKIGKETTYWIMTTIKNTSNGVSNLYVSAMIPEGVAWTGKTSVNHGKAPTFDNATRVVSWSLSSLLAHETAGISFEIGWTPEATDSDTALPLLSAITLTAHDSFIDTNIVRTHPPLDTSLPKDALAKKKGIVVVQ